MSSVAFILESLCLTCSELVPNSISFTFLEYFVSYLPLTKFKLSLTFESRQVSFWLLTKFFLQNLFYLLTNKFILSWVFLNYFTCILYMRALHVYKFYQNRLYILALTREYTLNYGQVSFWLPRENLNINFFITFVLRCYLCKRLLICTCLKGDERIERGGG